MVFEGSAITEGDDFGTFLVQNRVWTPSMAAVMPRVAKIGARWALWGPADALQEEIEPKREPHGKQDQFVKSTKGHQHASADALDSQNPPRRGPRPPKSVQNGAATCKKRGVRCPIWGGFVGSFGIPFEAVGHFFCFKVFFDFLVVLPSSWLHVGSILERFGFHFGGFGLDD